MKAKRIRCKCGSRFTPKRSNQLHCSPECRKASYEGSSKAAVRRLRYNSGEGRQRVQREYNGSTKGAVRRARWQYSKAGRAWREAWYAPRRQAKKEACSARHAERLKTEEEAWERIREARESSLRQHIEILAQEHGVSVIEAARNYLDTVWHGVPAGEYLKQWLPELREAA